MMLKVENLVFKYGKNEVLNNINFEIGEGDAVAILGNNGVGKSSLIKCLNKIISPVSGTVYLNGQNIKKISRSEIAKEIAYVAQLGELSPTTVFDTVMLGRMPYVKINPSKNDYKIVEDILKKIQIEDLSFRLLTQLSGGQVQKVMLARALAQEPKILILDEPTNNLDMKSQHNLLSLVKSIVDEQDICVIEVLHDLNLAMRYCNKFLFLKDKTIYSFDKKEDITTQTIKDVFDINVDIQEIRGHKTAIFIENFVNDGEEENEKF